MSYERDEKTGRRRFVRTVVGGGAAAAAASGCVSFGAEEHVLPRNAEAEQALGREAGQWIPSCCSMCGGQSGILAHVVDGKVDQVEPNHWNPNNYSTNNRVGHHAPGSPQSRRGRWCSAFTNRRRTHRHLVKTGFGPTANQSHHDLIYLGYMAHITSASY